MRIEADGEKLLRQVREATTHRVGMLRVTGSHIRTIARDVAQLKPGQWWQADMSRAHFLSYCTELQRLCSEQASELEKVNRLALSPLENLAQMARENDF